MIPPKYTNGMPGHKWDMMTFDPNNRTEVALLEIDAADMIEYLGKDSREISDTWLFQYGGIMTLTNEDIDIQTKACKNLYDSGSWILQITAIFIKVFTMTSVAAVIKAMGGEEEVPILADTLVERGISRKAKNELEDHFIDVLIKAMPNLLSMSTEGMSHFKMYRESSTDAEEASHTTDEDDEDYTPSHTPSSSGSSMNSSHSDKSRGICFFLCIFFGVVGFHRFYVGKTGTGLIWMFTCGMFGLGWLYDLYKLWIYEFEDADGYTLF